MPVYRTVSADNTSEAITVAVASAIERPDYDFTITTDSLATWPDYPDFITYQRNSDGELDESTRIAWSGRKIDNNNIIATKLTESDYIPGSSDYASVVPHHAHSNDMINALAKSLPQDGEGGINMTNGNPVHFSVGATAPGAIPGRTVIWFKPLG